MRTNLITILGATATGKTKLAAKLALKYNGEIISADSRQVYIGLDIGTGKDLKDYIIDNEKINYHLIDVLNPSEEFNLFMFKELFAKAYKNICARNKLPFLVGGTGLYISSIIQNYNLKRADFRSHRFKELESKSLEDLQQQLLKLNPKIHVKKDLLSKNRLIKVILIEESDETLIDFPQIHPLVIGIKLDRETIRQKITDRLKKRLDEGMINEVKLLLSKGITHERLLTLGLEYKYITLFLMNKLSFEDMFNKLNTSIHQFAKRQMTWFRKMEREGIKINWLNGADFDAACAVIDKNLF